MSGFYKKAVVWLGLNEEYPDDPVVVDDSWDDGAGDAVSEAQHAAQPGPQNHNNPSTSASNGAQGNPLAPAPLSPDRDSTTVRAVPMDDHESPGSSSAGGSGTVRAMPLAKTLTPEAVVPTSFNNAQDVADVYKNSKPVVVDLSSAERDLARRLIDFSAGLCYGLGGRMEKLTTDVYLLIPDGVDVSDDDRSRLSR